MTPLAIMIFADGLVDAGADLEPDVSRSKAFLFNFLLLFGRPLSRLIPLTALRTGAAFIAIS